MMTLLTTKQDSTDYCKTDLMIIVFYGSQQRELIEISLTTLKILLFNNEHVSKRQEDLRQNTCVKLRGPRTEKIEENIIEKTEIVNIIERKTKKII